MHIDERSKISLFAVLASLPVLVGGIIWLTTIDNKVNADEAKLEELTELIRETHDKVIVIGVQINKLIKER